MENKTDKIVARDDKKPAIIRWSLIVSIIIVSNLFVNYAISLVYPEPKYPDYMEYCPAKNINPAMKTAEECQVAGGAWTESVDINSKYSGVCDLNFTCNEKYNQEMKKWTEISKVYNRNVFIVLAVIGVVLLAFGSLINLNNLILSLSSTWSGVLSIVIASVRYWSDAGNWLRVLILFLALSLLVYLAAKKFKD